MGVGRERWEEKICGRRQEVWGGIYTKQQRAYNYMYASGRIPQYYHRNLSAHVFRTVNELMV